VSPEVLVAQLPVELEPGREYPAQVVVKGAYSLPLPVSVVPVRPGAAAFPDGRLIAQHVPSYALVTPENPAKPGESLVMYLVGMGATNPVVPTGIATPAQLVPTVSQAVVHVGGQQAQIQYSGLTPTGIGLYQVNFQVPAGTLTADVDVVITQDGVPGNTTKLPVRK
jgi:uncharacterized protein (TIGR03437 family)